MAEEVADLDLDLLLASFIVLESVDVGLECNLLRRVNELSVLVPPPMASAPRLAFEALVATQHECLDADPISPNVLTGCVSGTDQIAEHFMQRIRHSNVGQFTRSK